MAKRGEGKVVRVLSPSEVVVNLGGDDGVGDQQHFVVYALGEEIKDPETGESLGRLEILRGRGRAKHVQGKMTTVESSERRTELRDRERPVARSRSRQLLFPTLGSETEIVSEEVQVQAPFKGVQVGDLVRVD